MEHPDTEKYIHFATPYRLKKALNTLEGMMDGISLDNEITPQEAGYLRIWVDEHSDLARWHPFNELVPVLSAALKDGVLDSEERQGILWLCGKMSSGRGLDRGDADGHMQRFQAMMAGIASDGRITELEAEGLKAWMRDHSELRGCWPYDEIDSLLLSVLQDGRIDADEHDVLLAFFRDFFDVGDDQVLGAPVMESGGTITGVCAVCPDILFESRVFCFSGNSKRARRAELHELVERLGGKAAKSMVQDLDYLVIGADGNPCWMFACYGRKVEEAIRRRKQGAPLQVVHEHDFWDAVEDAGY